MVICLAGSRGSLVEECRPKEDSELRKPDPEQDPGQAQRAREFRKGTLAMAGPVPCGRKDRGVEAKGEKPG